MKFRFYLCWIQKMTGLFVLSMACISSLSVNTKIFARGLDTSNGVLTVPKTVTAIVVDGQLDEWNLMAKAETAIELSDLSIGSATYALSYDLDGLNLAVQVKDLTPMRNQNDPVRRKGWAGDCIQLRLDPLGKGHQFKDLYHLTFWYHHRDRKSYAEIQTPHGILKNPLGVKVAFRKNTDGKGYVCEAHIPWKALGLSQNPKSGSTWPALIEILFGNESGTANHSRSVGLYTKHPGVFGFNNKNGWGKLVFSKSNLDKPQHLTLMKIFEKEKTDKKNTSIPIAITLRKPGQVSLNILKNNGDVLREMVTEKTQPAGKFTIRWDGKNRFGQLLDVGKYHWIASIHSPLKAQYIGAVGSSGNPPEETADGLGAWGSDHTNPLDVTVDETGSRYFLWRFYSEQGKSIVKINAQGKTIWRTTPFAHSHFGDFWSIAVDDQYLYVLAESKQAELGRVNRNTGKQVVWKNNISILVGQKSVQPKATAGLKKRLYPGQYHPYASGTGLAVHGKKAYVSLYFENTIAVVDLEKEKVVGHLPLVKPCGLTVDKQGNLYAISQNKPGISGQVVVFKNAQGSPRPLITKHLKEPWDLTQIENSGKLVVTDMAPDVNQVCVFTANGQLLQRLGQKGGRPWAGRYQPENFLQPAGIASTHKGGFIVCEDSPPKVITEYDQNENIMAKWFGPAVYGTSIFPDIDDPYHVYYSQSGSLYIPPVMARSRINPQTGQWNGPEAYWDGMRGPFPKEFATHLSGMDIQHIRKVGRHKFLCSGLGGKDSFHGITRVEGDSLIPVAFVGLDRQNYLQIWQDANKNGKVEKIEVRRINKFYPVFNFYQSGSMYADADLNLYLAVGMGKKRSPARKLLYLPCQGVDKDGLPSWDLSSIQIIVQDLYPDMSDRNLGYGFGNGWRKQIQGIVTDSQKNIYVTWTAGPTSTGPHWSSSITHARLTKYNPDGKRVWEVGRKAMGPRKDGEIYNIWCMAGIVDDRYVVIGDETGLMHFYTKEGLYRGHLFNDIGRPVTPGPYTFTGETFSGRVQYYPKLKKTFAYQGQTAGLMFEVKGLGHEALLKGEVEISPRQYELLQKNNRTQNSREEGRIAILPDDVKVDLKKDKWVSAKPFVYVDGENPVGEVKVGVNATSLLVRFEITDKTPWLNNQNNLFQAFKSGDAVGLYIGPESARRTPVVGDTRILLVPNGAEGVRVIGMKPKTQGKKKPQTYGSPVQTRSFDWVGDVVNAEAKVTRHVSGYIVEAMIPLSFFEGVSLKESHKIRFDADVMFSDQTGRKTMRRLFIYGRGPEVSMVNDLPTEAWLYPAKWKILFVGRKPSARKKHLDPSYLFKEVDAVFLEGEAAPILSKGFKRFLGVRGISCVRDVAGLDPPLQVGWKLKKISHGKKKLFVSWAKSGNKAVTKITVLLGSSKENLRKEGVFQTKNAISYKAYWHKAPFLIQIKPSDKFMVLNFKTKNYVKTQFAFDAVALLPYLK